MLVNLPSKFIEKFYDKTSSEIDAIVEEALEAYFSDDKPESSPASAISDFKSDLTLRLIMQVADKLDELKSAGIQVTSAVKEVAKPKPVEKIIPEFEQGAVGDDALADFLLDIMK